MKVGSLFSGCGGLDLGLHYAGLELAWGCEIDGPCRTVLTRHWPAVALAHDVREIDAGFPAVDVLAGGFPCQDVSSAGRRAGVAVGTRSGLWFEYARAIRLLRPRVVVVENVRGLVVRGFGLVLSDLADAGYDARWCCFRAADVGAPHGRERVFIVATDANLLNGRGRSEAERLSSSARPGAAADVGLLGGSAVATDTGSMARPQAGERGGGPRARGVEGSRRQAGPPLDGAAGRAGEAAADADIPSFQARFDTGRGGERARLQPLGPPSSAADADGEPVEPRLGRGAEGGDHARPRPAERDGDGFVGQAEPGSRDWGPYGDAVRTWEEFTRPAPRPVDDLGRLEPAFVEWMLGFPDGWTDGVTTRTHRLRMLGNAVQVQAGELVGLAIVELLEGME